jgi:hypothetical protein
MKFKTISRVVISTLAIIASFAIIQPVSAANAEPEANVRLVATLNNGPAMRPVKWTLYRLNNDHATWVDSFQRHSASIPLVPGFYRADVSLQGVNRSRVFEVSSITGSNVVIPMD